MQIEQKSGERLRERKLRKNEMKLEFDAVSENEAFARVAVAAFVTPLNPTVEEISDIKTAVSEAVTNAIIHGYDRKEECGGTSGEEILFGEKENKVYLHCVMQEDVLHVEVTDEGKGIENIEQAMEPLYTTRPDMDRSGMGFAFMEAFMDDLEVISELGLGTTILMKKKLGTTSWLRQEE